MWQQDCHHTSYVKNACRPEDGSCQNVRSLVGGGRLDTKAATWWWKVWDLGRDGICTQPCAVGNPSSCPLTSGYYFSKSHDHFYLFAHLACPLHSHLLSPSLWLWLEPDTHPYNLRKMLHSLMSVPCPRVPFSLP